MQHVETYEKERWLDDFGNEFAEVHSEHDCGDPCAVHNPSAHPMVGFRQLFRGDRPPLIERICPHGCGHPDPDTLRWLADAVSLSAAQVWYVHGCDGCCRGSYDFLWPDDGTEGEWT